MSVLTLNVDEVMRTLSAESSNPFVVHDKEVDIVRFAINSGFADIVLDGQVALRVMYQRPGETEVRAQTLTYYDTDGLHNYYDWQLSQSDLAKNGSLMVALCILDISGGEVSEWHTTPCAVRVLSTIHTDDSDEGDDTITPTVKERVAVLESMIQRVASGAPIVVSSASAMTDTDQIYVLKTDGKWYYHNGTAWTAGGEYGGVLAGSITTDKLAYGAVTTAKIADGAITAGKIANGVVPAVDATLAQTGSAADAKKTGDELTDLKNALDLFNAGIACKRNSSVDTTQDGIKYIYNGEYWVLDGTCTGSNQVYLLNSPNELPSSIKSGKTAYVCFETDIVGVKARIWPFVNGEQQSAIYDSNKSGEIVIPEGTTGIKIALFTSNGTKATNQTVLYYLLTRKPLYETQEDIVETQEDIVEIREDIAETNENLTKTQTDLDKAKDTVKQVASISLFNIDTVETGVYLDANGTKYFTDDGGITDFIDVQSDNYAVAFTLSAGTNKAWYLRIHGYDSNKQWVAQISTYLMQAGQTGDIFHQFAVPSGISYIKVSVYFYVYTSNLQIGKSDNGVIVTAIDRVARNSIEELSNRIDLFDFNSPEFPMNEFKRTAIDFYASFDTITNWETMSSLSDVKQFGVYNGGYVDSHIADYQDYALRAYFINGRSNYMAFIDGDPTVTNNYYRLNSPYTDSGLPNARPEGFYPRKKIMIVSGMHGDEGGTPNYLKEFVRKLVNDNDFCTFFADYDFCIIPLSSPYAFSIDRRETRYFNESTGQIETFNLNRDFPIDGSTPITNEAKFIESVYNADEYDFVIDLHMLTWDSATDDMRQGFGCVDTSLTSDTAVPKFYRAISGAGEKTERTIKSFYELDKPQQTTYTWEGIARSGANQFIDYAIGRNYTGSRHKADYVLMTETSTYCYYYSNSATKYNQISCSFGSNFNENVLKNVLGLFVDL